MRSGLHAGERYARTDGAFDDLVAQTAGRALDLLVAHVGDVKQRGESESPSRDSPALSGVGNGPGKALVKVAFLGEYSACDRVQKDVR